MSPLSITVLILSIVSLVVYLVWKTLHFSVPFLQRKLAFMPTDRSEKDLIEHADTTSPHLSFQDTECRTQDGERLTGVYGTWTHADSGATSDRVLLFLHGNSYCIEYCIAHAVFVASLLEANVLIMDYRGFGSSSGMPTAWGLRLDGESMLYHATNRHRPDTVSHNRVYVMGHSMGCAVALHLARRFDSFAGLILSAPFDEFRHAAFHIFPILQFIKPFMTEMFNNVEAATFVRKTPVLIAHSKEDEVCPYEGGRAVYLHIVNKTKKWVTSSQCSHSGPHVTQEGIEWIRDADRGSVIQKE